MVIPDSIFNALPWYCWLFIAWVCIASPAAVLLFWTWKQWVTKGSPTSRTRSA